MYSRAALSCSSRLSQTILAVPLQQRRCSSAHSSATLRRNLDRSSACTTAYCCSTSIAPNPAAAPRRQRPSPRRAAAITMASALPKDYTTQSNYADLRETARHYELDVDFGRSVIEGYAKVRRGRAWVTVARGAGGWRCVPRRQPPSSNGEGERERAREINGSVCPSRGVCQTRHRHPSKRNAPSPFKTKGDRRVLRPRRCVPPDAGHARPERHPRGAAARGDAAEVHAGKRAQGGN
jgi:hypothetical protein